MNYDKDSLILSHLKLAEDIGTREWRTATHALRKDDMISLANLGLVDAASRWLAYCEKNEYDPAAVQYFKVFAALRIRGTIRDFLRKEDWVTRTLRSKSKKLKDAGQDEGLSVEDLASLTGMTVSEINKVNAKLASKPVSLDAKIGLQDYENNTKEIQIKEDIDTEGKAFANEILRSFVKAFKTLSQDMQVVLTLHYFTKLDFRRIAEELNLSEAKVSQLHIAGITYIKEVLTLAATESV